MNNLIATLYLILCFSATTIAQLQIGTPNNSSTTVTNAKQFITGTLLCKDCGLTINNEAVKVYSTGSFAYQANLKKGSNLYTIRYNKGEKQEEKIIEYILEEPKPIMATDSLYIEQLTITPSGDLQLMPGETIFIQAKAKPGCKVVVNNTIVLKEQPKANTKGVAGYYTTSYRVKAGDDLQQIQAVLYDNNIQVHTRQYKNSIKILDADKPIIGRTIKDFTPVYMGLGTDRLGGAKLGYLDSMVHCQIIGAVGDMYKVQFAPQHIYYIPQSAIKINDEGADIPTSLTNSMSVTGDSLYDYVRISLNTKLPYSSTMQAKQKTIELLLYGATSNTNWITQYPETLQAIADVDIDQMQHQVVKITAHLKQNTHWGYSTYYEGNTLVMRVRRQKKNLALRNLVIGVDAGHGGSNKGALGIAGRYEKEFTLLIAQEVTKLLQAEGATVINSRQSDIDFDNAARLKYFVNKLPDIAISIHLNSAADPIRVKGTSTYYKHHAMKGLSQAIYGRMVETGLKPWGHIGNFNFFLNSVTEFPTALIETLFISNPEDEEKVHNEAFRKRMAKKIVQGIKDWLQQVEQLK